jgi:hypothetical protein
MAPRRETGKTTKTISGVFDPGDDFGFVLQSLLQWIFSPIDKSSMVNP